MTTRKPSVGSLRQPGIGAMRKPSVGSLQQPGIGAMRKPSVGSLRQPGIGGAMRKPSVGSLHQPGIGGAMRKPSVGSLRQPGIGGAMRQPSVGSLRIPNVGPGLGPITIGRIGRNGIQPGHPSLGPPSVGRHNISPSHQNPFAVGYNSGHFNPLIQSQIGRQLNLHGQFNLHQAGDVARQLNLAGGLLAAGGWRQRPHHGLVSRNFVNLHFGGWYAGPAMFPHRVWFPRWNDWVRWSWWDQVFWDIDPRPIICRPVFWNPAPHWVAWHHPGWITLPVISAGTWVDVPMPIVPDAGTDLQLLAVRYVDSGHPKQQLGPRYRVWFRNTSAHDLDVPMNVMLFAALDGVLAADLPQAGVRVERIEAGQIQSVDIRLPIEAMTLAHDAKGRAVPFTKLHVLVDSHNEIAEVFEENNGAVLDRGDVLPVDPAVFSVDVDQVVSDQPVTIAGEGFGPEPGVVIIYVKGLELQAVIEGWYDLGVRVQVPKLPLAGAVEADIVVVRGDGAASNPITVTMLPVGAAVLPAPAPAP